VVVVTFLPVVAWPLLLFLVLAALVAVWWPSDGRMPVGRSGRAGAVTGSTGSIGSIGSTGTGPAPTGQGGPGSAKTGKSVRSAPSGPAATRWRLTAAVALLGTAALRPGLPGGEVDTTAANLNVYFVVDTTTSIVAEDYGNERPRALGVRDDIVDIARALPGARYSVLTFDQSTRVRLPLTTDTTALGAAVETLAPEPSEYSRGTTVSEARERLAALLEQASTAQPERGRVVFYLGDGEQTAADPPAPFEIREGLVNGGAVLGYGTSEGGRMRATAARFGSSTEYLKDPTTGEDARSVADEGTLRAIAEQLRVPYVHREAGDGIGAVVDGIDLDRYGTNAEIEQQRVRAREELYWPLLLGVAGLAVWEVGAAVAGITSSRRRQEAAP
jgi:Ca-activated chloride channel family protein